MKRHIASLLGIILSLSIASNAFALGSAGISNEVISAKSLGAGATGVAAVSDDPMTIYTNPAGLTALKGTQVTLGATWENLHGKYKADSGPGEKMRSIDMVVPNFAATQSLMDGKLGVGLGVLSAYGLDTHWPSDMNSPLRYIATNSRLHTIDITPGVAYRIHPMVSVGVGADYVNMFTAELEKNVNMNNLNNGILIANGLPPAFAGLSDGDSKLSGTAANWGYHAGVTFQPTEQHSFGLTYHSKVKMGINGSVTMTGLTGPSAAVFGGSTYSTSANTTLYLPQNVQFGYAFKPNDKWTLEADTAWYDWFSNRDLNVRYPNATATQVAFLTNGGAGNPTPLNWRDAWSFATGANYKCNDQLQLRTGFWYEPWSEPESAFSPALLDLTRYGLTLGAGYAFTPAISLDVAYNAVFFHARHITNNIGFNSTGDPTTNIKGNFTDFANLVSANVSYKFGNGK
jgi:long-chain fatty acid transport protein